MKTLTILSLLSFSTLCTTAQIKIGAPAGDVPVKTILNAPVTHSSLGSLKGKLILLDFWATWCAPCVQGMPHLQELQKAFKENLQVITISDEKEQRIRQFLTNKPSNLWFAVDTLNEFRKAFPNRAMPHSVLIDQQGNIIASTHPENITASVIADALAGKKINLPLKEDLILDNPWETFFHADSTLSSRFIIQPEIKGIGGQSMQASKGVFANRRYSTFNLTLQTIYRSTYRDLSSKRVTDLTKKNSVQTTKLYSMDIIVPKGQEKELFPSVRKELASRFDIQAVLEKAVKPVYVLVIADKAKIAKLEKTAASTDYFAANGGTGFTKQPVQFKNIADFLEQYGATGIKLPVVDETGDSNYYSIEFFYTTEKPGDLEAQLAALGLKLVPAEREIEMLVIREEK